MYAHQRCGAVGDRGFVVGEARAVRRAGFDEPRARLPHDVRDAEAAADLDELAARDHDFPPRCQRRQREEYGGRIVVHRHRRLGAGQPTEQRLENGRAASRASRSRRRIRGCCSRERRRPSRRSPSASGARPRFVWRTTPVALISGRSGAARTAVQRLRTSSTIRASEGAPAPAAMRARASSSASRVMSSRSASSSSAPARRSSARTRSTEGKARYVEAAIYARL